jgi:integrase/recombinase XerC
MYVARPSGDDAVRLFGEYQRRKNLSPSTIRHRRLRLKALQGWLDKDILDATHSDLEKWLDHFDIAPQTKYTYTSYIAAFYRWAHKQRLVKSDPSEDLIRPKLPKRVPRPWDEEGIGHALTEADDRMACWLLLAHFAGARVKEMAELRVEDIHRDQNVILLHGKGDKERLVPLHPLLLDALLRYGLPRAGYVFRRLDGKPLLPTTISKYVGRFTRAHGVDATAHQGRHAFATNAYRASGGEIRMVQDLMGHASPASTAIYAAWAPERAAVVVEQLTLPGT